MRIRTELAGKDLACWCPLDALCHADVLLRWAQAPALAPAAALAHTTTGPGAAGGTAGSSHVNIGGIVPWVLA
jgi:hypothetical protein